MVAFRSGQQETREMELDEAINNKCDPDGIQDDTNKNTPPGKAQ